MTIDNENYKNVYSGNDSVKDFAFTFQISEEDQILVTVDDVDVTTGYTVALNEDGTGTVSFTTAPATGDDNVVLRLNDTFTQEVDLEETGAFNANVLEEIANKLTRLIKQVKEITARSIVQNPNQTSEIEFPSPSANLLIGWNATADGLENKTAMDADAQAAAELAADEAQAAQIAAEAAQAAAEQAAQEAEAVAGWEVATESEATSGVDNTKVMTPLRVEQAFLDNILDEDDFASDSATLPPSQQSVGAYVASNKLNLKTGVYTGDGSTSQEITGVGFQPKYIRIWPRETSDAVAITIVETTDTIIDDSASGMSAQVTDANIKCKINKIIAIGSDGFTVDDAGIDNDPNKNGSTYNYMCIG